MVMEGISQSFLDREATEDASSANSCTYPNTDELKDAQREAVISHKAHEESIKCSLCRLDRKKCTRISGQMKCDRCLQLKYSCDLDEDIAQMPNRTRRKLNYLKCANCRLAKQKCLPEDRQPGQKCDRCKQKNLRCSEPQEPTPSSRKRRALDHGKDKALGDDTLQFPCPFSKNGLAVDSTCFVERMVVSRLQQHLREKHMPEYCEHCLTIFPDQKGLGDHVEQYKGDCSYLPDISLTWISYQQRRNLDELYDTFTANTSEEEKWLEIWRLLFPLSIAPKSIYTPANNVDELKLYCQRYGPAILANKLSSNGFLPPRNETTNGVHVEVHRLLAEGLDAMIGMWLSGHSPVEDLERHSGTAGTDEHSTSHFSLNDTAFDPSRYPMEFITEARDGGSTGEQWETCEGFLSPAKQSGTVSMQQNVTNGTNERSVQNIHQSQKSLHTESRSSDRYSAPSKAKPRPPQVFTCSSCSKRFSRKFNLRRHEKYFHRNR